ncbi:MAG: glycosyltransferase [Chloroflexota bacterium]|nr:glycosyltransferase [Chloroflexota bacterium]
MYGTLALSHRALDELADVAGDQAIAELRKLARPLEGLRVLNLSVNGFGTGTAELLNSSVPLLVDLGLDVQWQVVRSSEEDIAINRAMYYALGGVYTHWTQEMTDAWLRYAAANADLLTDPFDVIIVHDPQPLAIRSFVRDNDAKWLMHSHLDLSSAQDDVWMLLRSHVEKYDRAIFSAPHFRRSDIKVPSDVIEPAIDPKSARNMPLPDDVVRRVLERYGINPDRPMICQISPCDAASDLAGAVEAWEIVRNWRPEIQLVLVLTTEPHDPQGRACYEELARRTQDEPAVFVVSVGSDLGNVELNVFQTAASVVMQKGLRKGFGLWVSDALWKRRPCVVAPAGGLTEQVVDGETGLIARSTEEFAGAIERLLGDPDLARRLGRRGREHVAERFLITRYLKDYLHVLDELHRGS